MSFRLIVGAYNERHPKRRAEFRKSLLKNNDNPAIKKIHVVAEDLPPPKFIPGLPKIEIIGFGRRMKYDDAFNIANGFRPGTNVVLANADIYFDDTLQILDRRNLDGILVCLSRWNEDRKLVKEPALSHDAWIFSIPFPEIGCSWNMGVLGCDGRVAAKAAQNDLTVINPCYSVRAHHLHGSGIRNYDPDEMPFSGSAHPVPPCSVEQIPSFILPLK